MDPLSFDQDTLSKFQQAKAAGVPDNVNIKHAIQYQSTKAQRTLAQPQVQQKPQGPDWTDLLPLIGGIGGSFIPGLGTIVGGAAGAGLGTFLKQNLQHKPTDVGEIAKETALGGAGGILGEGVGWLGGKLLGKLGGGLASAGEDVGIKALRLNPSQLKNFIGRHGEEAGQFLAREGAIGKDASTLALEHIEPLQQQFNTIAKTSGLKVNPSTFQENILAKAKELIDAGGTENASIADDLIKEAIYIAEKDLAPHGYDISKVDALRRNFASKVNWNDPVRSTKNFALADALRKTAIDTADQAGMTGAGGIGLKDIGIKLSKFRDLENAAIAQEQLGKGSAPAGILKWLSVIAGTGAGGLGGGLAGLGIGNVVNSPEFLRLLATGAVKGGQALEKGIAPSVGGQLLGTAASQGAVRVPEAFNGGGAPTQDLQTLSDNTTIPQPSNMASMVANKFNSSDQNTTSTQEDQLRKVLAAIMFSKAKNVSDIKTAYEFLQPTASKPLAAEQQKLKANAESGLQALQKVETLLKQDPNAPLKSKIPFVQGRSPYAAAAKEVADVYTRLRTGAALNNEEQAFYDSQLPQPFDSPDTITYKLGLFKNLFQKYAYGQQPTGNDFQMPSGF